MSNELLSLKEVAQAAGVSVWTVRRYIARGVIAAHKNQRGWIRLEADAAEKVRAHFLVHGAPGGRPIPQ